VIGSRLRVAPGTAHRARSTPGPQPLVWPGRYRALVANAGSPMNHAAGESFTWTNTESFAGAGARRIACLGAEPSQERRSGG